MAKPFVLDTLPGPSPRRADPGYRRSVEGDLKSPGIDQCKAPLRGEVLPVPAAPRPAFPARLR